MRLANLRGTPRILGALVLATAFAFGSTTRPAAADQAATTRNIILGAVLAAGVATAVNVSRKNAAAGNVVGYTPDGSRVYQDGHVTTPNGQTYYPGNEGQSVSCNGQACQIVGSNAGTNGYPYGYNGSGYASNTVASNGYYQGYRRHR